ncbi:hypothetical protein BKA80DRAFT_319245 [Phyllosticta citrichinensis]
MLLQGKTRGTVVVVGGTSSKFSRIWSQSWLDTKLWREPKWTRARSGYLDSMVDHLCVPFRLWNDELQKHQRSAWCGASWIRVPLRFGYMPEARVAGRCIAVSWCCRRGPGVRRGLFSGRLRYPSLLARHRQRHAVNLIATSTAKTKFVNLTPAGQGGQKDSIQWSRRRANQPAPVPAYAPAHMSSGRARISEPCGLRPSSRSSGPQMKPASQQCRQPNSRRSSATHSAVLLSCSATTCKLLKLSTAEASRE